MGRRLLEVCGSAMTLLVALVVLTVPAASGLGRKTLCLQSDSSKQSLYDFSLMDVHKENMINLSRFADQQEPGANGTEILNSLKHVRPGNGFEPPFQLFEKIDVNGDGEHPLYTYLKAYCPPVQDVFNTAGPGIYYAPYKNSDVRWNFEKFLINRNGKPVLRYHTHVLPADIRNDIMNLLKEPGVDPVTFF